MGTQKLKRFPCGPETPNGDPCGSSATTIVDYGISRTHVKGVWRTVSQLHNLGIGAARPWQLLDCVFLKTLLAIGRFTIARAGLCANQASVV